MTDVNSVGAYLEQADAQFNRQITEQQLKTAASNLPPLDRQLLDELAERAENAAISEPRRGWAITRTAEAAANLQTSDPFLRSLAAWYVGRAANRWVQPKKAEAALRRARRGFLKLEEGGWVAACDWQLYELPWTRSDLSQGVVILKKALDQLQHFEFSEFVPHCRLALADAQVQTGEFEAARQNIQLSEADFAARNDLLNQARCWRLDASRARRQARLDEAKLQLDRAFRIFEDQHAFVDIAKNEYSLAMLHLFRTDDLSIPILHFKQAIEMFTKCDLKLWRAASVNNLGATYLQAGELIEAEACFQEAMRYYARHGILAFLASTLEDSGKLKLAKGFPEASVLQYQKAGEIYEKLGLKLGSALLAANLGQAYGQLGRYQDALRCLERGMEQLAGLHHSLHLGTAEKYAALVWTQLGQPAAAHALLEKAAEHYAESSQKALLASLYNTRASVFFKEGDTTHAISWLEKSLEVAIKHGIKPQIGLAHRLLGEALVMSGQWEAAPRELEQALAEFSEMGMSMEQAATQVALANYYAQTARAAEAKEAYQKALQLSSGTTPEADWRAQAGLAELAMDQNDTDAALNSYRQAVETLSKIRSNFWQPALAGSYLQTPSFILDKAISLAVKNAAHQECLEFVEAGKAATILKQVSGASQPAAHPHGDEARELKAEIEWRQTQLRASFEPASRIKSAVRTRELREQLIRKIREYDESVARLERQRQSEGKPVPALEHFELDAFRALANQNLGEAWIALDYYKAKNQLVLLTVTANRCLVTSTPVSERAQMALEAITRRSPNAPDLLRGDVYILGDLLLPDTIKNLLTPQTHLLLAPHENLHGVPWAALQPSWLSTPLAGACIPSVIPTLHSLSLLWRRRSSRQEVKRGDGLLIGISEFHGRYKDLPVVKEEVHKLSGKLGTGGRALFEQDATLENLWKLKNPHADGGLAGFAWMHIASHFSPDLQTGRSSGIAMADKNLWLDQIRDLAPVPSLVSLSACNGLFHRIYEGNEQVGLPVTCLISGAESIVGSVWPVLDRSSADFMLSFYDHYLGGASPAEAVTLVQRESMARHVPLQHWASFTCIGIP